MRTRSEMGWTREQEREADDMPMPKRTGSHAVAGVADGITRKGNQPTDHICTDRQKKQVSTDALGRHDDNQSGHVISQAHAGMREKKLAF